MLSLYSLIINYTVLISELISLLPNMDFFKVSMLKDILKFVVQLSFRMKENFKMLRFFPGKEMQEIHQLYLSRYRADGFMLFLCFSVQSHLFSWMWHLYRYTYACT